MEEVLVIWTLANVSEIEVYGDAQEPENSMHSLKCAIKAFLPSLVSASRIKNSFLMIATCKELSTEFDILRQMT
jgi:hypothetical protein